MTNLLPKRLLYDHYPKCGGSSVTDYIKESYPFSDRWETKFLSVRESINEFHSWTQVERWRPRLLTGHTAGWVIGVAHPDTFLTTVIRDPVDRVLSYYHFILQTPEHFAHRIIEGKSLDELMHERSSYLCNHCVRYFSELTNKEFTALTPNQAVETALTNLMQYDLIGMQSDLQRYCDELRSRVALLTKFDGRRLNVTANRPSSQSISASTRSLIEQANELDIRVWEEFVD